MITTGCDMDIYENVIFLQYNVGYKQKPEFSKNYRCTDKAQRNPGIGHDRNGSILI